MTKIKVIPITRQHYSKKRFVSIDDFMKQGKPLQMIEFFSGSKTVAGVFKKHGWDTLTIDIDPKTKPDICSDVSDIDLNTLPGTVDFLWFSPDCSKFSRAGSANNWDKTTIKYRQYNYSPKTDEAWRAIKMLQSTITILRHYWPAPFVIENPIGRIHHMPELKSIGHYRYAVNYADFGFPYSKETYLFTNIWLPFSTKKVHSDKPGLRTINSRKQRIKVPAMLIEKIIDHLV